MKQLLQNQRLNAVYNAGPLPATLWTKAIILFLLLGFWRTGGAQSLFAPGNPPFLGDAPVGINLPPMILPTADLHVNGTVRFENLPLSFGLNRYLTTDPIGNLSWQNGIGVQQGLAFGQTLFWDNTDWQATSFFNVNPGTHSIGIDTINPLGKLHINESDPIGVNYLRFTRPAGGMAPMSEACIGQDGSSNALQIKQVAPYDIHLSTWNETAMILKGMTGFVGIGEILNPLDRLHLEGDTSGRLMTDNYIRWTTLHAPIGAQIGYEKGSSIFQIRQNQNSNMEFWTHRTRRMTIDNTGWVGIGTNAPLGVIVNDESDPGGGWTPTGGTWSANPRFSVSGGDIEVDSGLYAGGSVFIQSDRSLKTNISKLDDWRRILRLQAYSYNYIGKENAMLSYGFMAQDVSKVLPEFTATWRGKGAVNYIGFIPFLTQGIQEHDAKIEELKVENGELKTENQILRADLEAERVKNEQQEKRIAALEAFFFKQQGNTNPSGNENGKGGNGSLGQIGKLTEQPALEQNEPNPFSETTVIRYFLPENYTNAKIEVRNTEGRIVGSFPVSHAGNGNIDLSVGVLASGTYFYSLIIDGHTIETLKMILLK